MSISMYQASIPVFVRMLTTLSKLLTKAQAHAEAKKFDPNNFLAMRLAPDMLPFSKQVQIACDAAKLFCVRVTGLEVPKFDDDEASIAELQDRINKTVGILKNMPRDAIDGTEEKPITFKVGGQDVTFSAQDLLFNFATPNVYFHVTTAYDILRHGGVELGKKDFLGM
ncbi:MAG: hypothetical protein JWN73_4154 [Betaproteobacteria bacterium]|nr:hypothetical protein [Betaproteobacteria bacterium]